MSKSSRSTSKEERILFRLALLEELADTREDNFCKHLNLRFVDVDETLMVQGLYRKRFSTPVYVCPECGVSLDDYEVDQT